MNDRPLDRDQLVALAEQLGRPLHSLIVLAPRHDPLMAGREARRAAAEWFFKLWRRGLFGTVSHLRRIHYIIISARRPVRRANGTPYTNTNENFDYLCEAARDARYLGLIEPNVIVDRKNPEAMVFADETNDDEGYGAAIYIFRDEGSSKPPTLMLFRPTYVDPYHREVACEKSTLNDVLMPVCRDREVNLVTGEGELSLTQCYDMVRRAVSRRKNKLRVFYLSDFDPAGACMPVSVARKLDYVRTQIAPDLDIQLTPIALNHEQCVEYRLPRTPIKAGEMRAAGFEERFGSGATEIDALEALHPGVLAKTLAAVLDRYADTTLAGRMTDAAMPIWREIGRINGAVDAGFESEVSSLTARYGELRARYDEEVAKLDAERSALFDHIAEAKRQLSKSIDLDAVEWPEPEIDGDLEDPLYSSDRGYVEQVDRFRRHQGKSGE